MLFSIASPEAEIKPLQMWALMIAFLQMQSNARLIFNPGKFSAHFYIEGMFPDNHALLFAWLFLSIQ